MSARPPPPFFHQAAAKAELLASHQEQANLLKIDAANVRDRDKGFAKVPTHYRCRCGEFFAVPEAVIETWRDQSEHFGQVEFETRQVPRCPECDSDDLADANEGDE